MRSYIKISLFLFLSVFIIHNITFAQNSDTKEPDSIDATIPDGYKRVKEAHEKSKKVVEETEKDVNEAEVLQPKEEKPPVSERTSKLSNNIEGLDSNIRRPLYSTKGKRDPFKPFIKEVPKREIEAIITKTTPPIKRYSLDEFRIVGIVWVNETPKAMVIDPEKNTYFLGKDDEIGNREGVIIEVRENGLLVSEKRFFEDVFGEEKVEIKKSVLAFAEEE